MRPRLTLALGNFFSVAHFYLIIYIVAPYLATFMSQEYTGLVVSAGALATLAIFPYAPLMVAKIGARKLALGFGILEAATLLLLATNPVPVLAVILVAIACALPPIIAYGLDLLLEATVRSEEATGSVRTAFLTSGNVALILAPIALALLLGSTDAYGRVFLAAAFSLVPFVVLFFLNPLPQGEMPRIERTRDTIRTTLRDRDLRSTVFAFYLLQFFYYSAPLYVPLYLHTVIGMPWNTLGLVLFINLLPFLLLEYPAGVLADRLLGDKEMLLAGFLIAGTTLALFANITAATSLLITIGLLVLTRIGTALIEAMTEGHFFRRVSERDTSTVSVFRMARPLAALSAPVVCSIFLAFGGYWWLFVGIGLIVGILGAVSALGIRDVR